MTESPRDPHVDDDETAALDAAGAEAETEAVTGAADALRAAEAEAADEAPATSGEPRVADDETPAADAAADTPATDAAADVPDVADEPPTSEPAAPEESPATAPATSAPPVTAQPRRRAGGDGTAPAEPVVVRASARYVRTSARKARLVCDHIRGKSVTEARAILAYTPRAAAKPWSKLLESAVANAENNHELVGEELRISAVFADEGPTLKRFQPRAMGRATRIRKRTSHLTILLTPSDVPSPRGARNRRKGGR